MADANDEAAARAALAEMTERLIRGPQAALGVTATTPPDEVHRAFLQLTKRFHPARFGRMSADLHQQSNEVFLALRAAHDTLAPAATRGGQKGSNPLPVMQTRPVRSLPTAPTPTPTSATAVARPGPTRPFGSALPQAHPQQRTQPLPTTVRPPSGRDLQTVLDLLKQEQWVAAQAALTVLLQREPGAKSYRALQAYARGREAQVARRVDDARVELQEALAIDPDLQLAKTALAELFTRRK